MIPIVYIRTSYTTTIQGQTVKVVPCEKCETEYVYVLEREAIGTGTSLYLTNEQGAYDHSRAAAEDTLQAYLENDFEPIPCPVCGHYQKFMIPKLIEAKSFGYPIVTIVVLIAFVLTSIGVLNWTFSYIQFGNEHAYQRMILTWIILLLFCPVIYFLHRAKKAQISRFDPNQDEDEPTRIAKGKSLSMTRADFEKSIQENSESNDNP